MSTRVEQREQSRLVSDALAGVPLFSTTQHAEFIMFKTKLQDSPAKFGHAEALVAGPFPERSAGSYDFVNSFLNKVSSVF
jgi:hypothetical protein